MKINKVFEQSYIGNIKLNNRIIRSATHEGMGDENGKPQNGLVDLYVQLARGGVGAIITGMAGISQDGKALNNMIMLDSNEYIDDYQKITNEVHLYKTPIIMQLVHAGRQTDSLTIGGKKPVAPSALRDKAFLKNKPKKLSEKDIFEIINEFVLSIERAKIAGFDGVQLHLAHGFLLSQFLSPYMNRRNDRWGGSIDNRFRIVKEIIREARERVGDYPILAKINGYDFRKNGMNIDEAVKIAILLEQEGCAAVEVSCCVAEEGLGLNTVRPRQVPVKAILSMVPDFKDMNKWIRSTAALIIPRMIKVHSPIYNYNLSAAERIKSQITIPVITVGGIRKLNDITSIIDDSKADYVSMARPFIIEPDLVNKFKSGSQDESLCTSCSVCFFNSITNQMKCFCPRTKPIN